LAKSMRFSRFPASWRRFSSFSLTSKQVADYERDGFLAVRNFFSKESAQSLKKAANQIVADFDPKVVSVFTTDDQVRTSDEYFLSSGDKIRCFFEEHAFKADGTLKQDKMLSINKIGHGMHEYHTEFRRFSHMPQLHGLMKSLGYRSPAITQSMYIFKQPSIGGRVDAHQDSTFLFSEPQTLIGLWFAIEDATLSNGCLWAIPGSHKLGRKTKFLRNPSGSGTVFEPKLEKKLADLYDVKGAVSLEVPAGSLVLIHADLVHLSHDNLSTSSRHAYTLHLIESHAKWPAENWLQRSDSKPHMKLGEVR